MRRLAGHISGCKDFKEEEGLMSFVDFSHSPGAGTLYIKGEFDRMSGQHTNYYKVGIVRGDKDVRDRDKALKTGNPRKVTTVLDLASPFVQKLETRLHNEFASARIASTEWFHASLCSVEKMSERALELQSEIVALVDVLTYHHEELAPGDKPPVEPDKLASTLVKEWSILAADNSLIGKSRRAIQSALEEEAEKQPQLREIYFKSSERSAGSNLSATEVKKRHPDLYTQYVRVEPSSPKQKYLISAADLDPATRYEEWGILAPDAVGDGNLTPADLHNAFLTCWSAGAVIDWRQWIIEAQLSYLSRGTSGLSGVWEWVFGSRNVFDKEGFLRDYPELAEDCTTQTAAKTTYSPAEWLPSAPDS